MYKVWEFLKVKGFYIALGTGIVAFVALIAIYSYKENTVSDENDSFLDLNQEAENLNDEVTKNEEIAKAEDDIQDEELYENDIPGEVQLVDFHIVHPLPQSYPYLLLTNLGLLFPLV